MLVPHFQTDARLGPLYLAKRQFRLLHIVRRRELPHCLIPVDGLSSYHNRSRNSFSDRIEGAGNRLCYHSRRAPGLSWIGEALEQNLGLEIDRSVSSHIGDPIGRKQAYEREEHSTVRFR